MRADSYWHLLAGLRMFNSFSESLSTTERVNGGGEEDETLSRCKDLIWS